MGVFLVNVYSDIISTLQKKIELAHRNPINLYSDHYLYYLY